MEVGLNSLPDSINPNKFPAKLWRLVNNPVYNAICWDCEGETIVIDQLLFERQVLYSSTITSASANAFKTTKFSSFVRQLNLYGFKKIKPQRYLGSKEFQSFYNPKFKRDQPELIARLERLTMENKTKLQAGLKINCRPLSRYQHLYPDGDDRENVLMRVSLRDSLLGSPTNQQAPHPHYPHETQAYSRTPIPPGFLMRGAALPSALFSSGNELPVPLHHPYTGVNSSFNAVHIQQNFLAHTNHGSPNFTSYSPCNAQYQPGYYSPFFHRYHPNLVAPYMAGGDFQTGLFLSQSYYQTGYPVSTLCFGNNNQSLQKNENQEVENCEINLETVFKIADEIMEMPPNTCVVKVEPQDEVVPELESSSNTCDSNGAIRSIPFSAGPTIVSALTITPLVTYKEQCEELVPKEMSKDAIAEATTDHERDTDIVAITVGDTSRDSSLEL